MNIVEKAFSLLYPEKEFPYLGRIKYSGRFKDFNSNVRIRGEELVFHLSKKWKEVDQEIRIGLLQELLVRITKDKRKTMQMELYHGFIKNLHLAVPKERDDPQLSASFERINEKYFDGIVEKPNLVFGGKTTTTLGHYNFHNDTVTISTVFKDSEEVLLDLVMHHEILHKHLKFSSKWGRSRYHSTEFRKLEKKFEDYEENEHKLKRYLARCKVKRWFWG